jgi:hypothetical protein
MGGICCAICFNKSFHGLEMGDNISSNLNTMIRKISWGTSMFDTFSIKLSDDIKRLIAKIIIEHVKKNNISVLKLNGFVTEYIALNIAGYIFHKFIWDIIHPTLQNYPTYEVITQEYKDIFINKAIDGYINNFKEKGYFVKFVTEFKKKRKIEEYNIEYQLGKDVITRHLEDHLCTVVNEIINNDNIETFNYSQYMNTMINKQNIYEAELDQSFNNIYP